MTAGTACLWIAAAFAGLSVTGSLRAESPFASSTPLRALVMSSVFAATALALLELALWRSDLSVDFVVRHTVRGLPGSVRALTVFAHPAGAGLVTGVLLGVSASWVARRGDNRGVVAVAAITMLVVLAAPLAGAPLARLPWMPVDGQSPAVFFQQAVAVPYAAAQSAAVVAAALALGVRVQEWWRQSEDPPTAAHLERLAICCLAWQGMTHVAASVAAGLSNEVQPFLAGGSRFALAVVVAGVAHVVGQRAVAPAQSKVEASLGSLLVALSLALAPAGVVHPPTAVRSLGVLGGGVVLVGAWRARGALVMAAREGWRDVWQRRGLRVVPIAALGLGLVAALIGPWSRARVLMLESGGRASLGGRAELAHLGISRYDGEGVDVLALAVERRTGAKTQLTSAEQRAYRDARGSVVGGVASRPAVLVTAQGPLFVWLDDVDTNDRVRLRVALAPGLWLAWAGLALCSIWAVWPLAIAQRSR